MRRLTLLGLTFFLGGCASSTQPGSLRLSTSETLYQLPAQGSATIPFVAVNAGKATVYLEQCSGQTIPVVDRWDGSSWEVYLGARCFAFVGDDPAFLQPGEQFESRTSISERGVYRLRLGTSDTRNEAYTHTVASEPFEIR